MIPRLLALLLVVASQVVALPVADFKRVARDSGKDDYYTVVADEAGGHIAADYRPGMETETFGTDIPKALRGKVNRVRWRWRVRTFPAGGDDCTRGAADSAAGVFLTFHAGLKWSLLKYIWSEKRPVGAVCDSRDSLFLRRQTIVLESDGAVGADGATPWRSESLDPKAEYVKHFGGKRKDVPELVGIGLLTDGDQTNSPSDADYGAFSVEVSGR